TRHSQADFPQLDSGLDVPTFQQGEDLIECINKAMAFLSVVASRFPPLNNQLRTSSNPRNQETIQDGRVTVQQVQRRQTQSYAGTRNRGIATTSKGNYTAGQPRVMKCYNCQGEGHMARQCTQPKRPRNNSAFQTKDLDAYDSNCDDLSSAKAVLMANLPSCDSDILSKSQDAGIQDTNSSAPKDLLVLSLVEQMTDHVANLDKENQTNKMSQEKDTVIRKVKDRIKSLRGKDSVENVKKDIDPIKTINIELEHKNNEKFIENSDLSAQLQEKVFAISALKNKLRKLKGKNVVDTAISKPNATIAPGMFKLDIESISHRLKDNRDAHEEHIILLTSNRILIACLDKSTLRMFSLMSLRLALNSPKPSEKFVAVTPMNKDKRVRFDEPVTSSSNIPKQTDSLKTKDSNKPLLTSTGVTPTTSGKPTGMTFTIVGNTCPLSRITSTKVVPTKETSSKSVATPTQGILVYSRRLKATGSVGSSSNAKIVESKTSNSKEPKKSWGSTVSDVPSSSLNDYRLSKLFSGIWTPAAQSI
ncbi:retrovirus-related pol polyprotein from transposon TNT 1-94, partial [Tanacetum coccineum]